MALVVAEVEAVDVVAPEDDGLAVHGGAFAFGGFGEAYHELFQVDGSVAGSGGAILHALFPVRLDHGDGGQAKYCGDNWIQYLHV